MKKFFTPNLSALGRWVRGAIGLGLWVAALWLRDTSLTAAVVIVIVGAFALLEAVRGWCVMRACGIKTRL